MDQVSYIHVDSRSRDTTLYPGANAYTIFLNKPITNITRIDLVSAQVINPASSTTPVSNGYIWLDITELRTPFTYDARKLTLTNALGIGSPVSAISTIGAFAATVVGTTTATYTNVPAITDKGARFTVVRATGTVTSVTLTSSGNAYAVGETVTLSYLNVGGSTAADNITFQVTAITETYIQRNQTSSTTPATSFAAIPIQQAGLTVLQTNQTFNEATQYPWSITYPSRLDSVERLTIRWLDYAGAVVQFSASGSTAYDVNSFILRVYTTFPPVAPERPLGLPPPVKDDDRDKVYMGAIAFLLMGLVMILLTRRRR